MAGGTWSTQNKIRPGVYIRFSSADPLGLTVGDRGVVTICEPLSWGPRGTVVEISAGDDPTPYTGYPLTAPQNLFLRQIFAGSSRTAPPKKVLLYIPAATGATAASVTVAPLTVTAKYPGTRGNDITVVVEALTEPEDEFAVSTVVDGAVVDRQQAATIAQLGPNDWVTFSGTGAPAPTAGAPLTGGTDGTVSAAGYAAYLAAIEPYQFDIMIYDGTDATTMAAMAAFVRRIADEEGKYSQLVMANAAAPDSRFVINVKNGFTLSDGTALTAKEATWWVGGAQAGARYNQSLTYAAVPGAAAVSPMMTGSQYEAALTAGQFVFFAEDGAVKVEQDINSLVSYTADISAVYRKNRTMRLCSTVANDIYRQFSDGFLGVVNNNAVGRSRFKGVIVGYLQEIQAGEGIQNFSPDDVQVSAGQDSDAVVVNVSLQAVDSVEKIYMTIEIGKGVQTA